MYGIQRAKEIQLIWNFYKRRFNALSNLSSIVITWLPIQTKHRAKYIPLVDRRLSASPLSDRFLERLPPEKGWVALQHQYKQVLY